MRGLIGADGRRDDIAGLWAPLLIDSLADERTDIRQRLHRLAAVVRAEPFFPWTIDMLAACASISESRLHALFSRNSVSRLTAGCLPIAEIALRAGFSDQTALTRAMRNAVGETPAAYRRNRGIH
ncbi:bacterial regulatory helix-turn-helix protein, araC family domain-containing protein [Ditylenchus destructor]|nr:bacterial regulatory helix-turn-helix protein, araC family domain-containing protein [Ditylenchus destructor]